MKTTKLSFIMVFWAGEKIYRATKCHKYSWIWAKIIKNHGFQRFLMILAQIHDFLWHFAVLYVFSTFEKAMMKPSFVVFSERRYGLNKNYQKILSFEKVTASNICCSKKVQKSLIFGNKKKRSYITQSHQFWAIQSHTHLSQSHGSQRAQGNYERRPLRKKQRKSGSLWDP